MMLALRDVAKVYHKGAEEIRALWNVSLDIESGEFIAVVGPSGSGKTTFLNIVGCLDVPSSGTLDYSGERLSAMSDDRLSEYRRKRVSFVFQSFNLVPVLTVQENVELPLLIGRECGKKEAARRSRELIAAVGLEGKEARYPRELSGGQEQRVAIARALVKEPLVVLADEPTANLDSHMAAEIVELMRSINEKRGATFIFSTHDRLVMEVARRIVTLKDGLVVSDERR